MASTLDPGELLEGRSNRKQLFNLVNWLRRRWASSGGVVVGKFTGVIVTDGLDETTSYMADPGSNLAVANLAVGQRYPTSEREFSRLRATVVATTGVINTPVTVTLIRWQSGVIGTTTLVATIPAGSTVGQTFSDTTNSQDFADDDCFDLRLHANANLVAGSMWVSAILEGPA